MTAKKKIALVGFTASREDAPWDDPEWAVYGCNNLWAQPGMADKWPKCEGWYDLHDRATITGEGLPEGQVKAAAEAHTAWLRQGHLPCFVMPSARQPDWPKALDFPRDRILDWAGDYAGRRYFTNSVSWMVAHAIMELDAGGEIALYGIDMAQASEYCVSPDTRVLTADLRWVEADRIRVGDQVMAFDEEVPDGERRQWRQATVEAAETLIRPCYRLHLTDGTKLVSSAEHRWLVHRNDGTKHWRQTDRLVTPQHRKDRPSKLTKVLDTWDTARDFDAGYLAAAFDGEGHLSQRVHNHGTGKSGMSLGFSQLENAMAVEVERSARKYGFDLRKHANSSGGWNYLIAGGRANILRFLGQIRPVRLLDKFNAAATGEFRARDSVGVEEAEFIGDQPVIGLKTTTGTFIAEGFASHNSAQRPSCEYWLGVAEGRGIKVTVAPRADLLRCAFLYGSEDGSDFSQKMRARQLELQGRAAEAAGQADQLRAQLEQVVGMQNQLHGALDDCNYVIDVWLQPEGTRQGGDDPSVSSTASEPLLQVVPDG